MYCCCCLVAQFCLTLCDLMDCSTPGLSVPHHLPKFAQVHVHCIGDAIQSSHPLTPSSPFALNLPQHQGLFQWVGCSHQMTKILELQLQHQSFHYLGLISLKTDWSDLPAVQGTFRSLQHHSSKASILWHSAFFMVQLLQLYVTNHWEDHSLDYTDFCQENNASAFQHNCLGLSLLFCQEVIVFWFHSCSLHLQWF